MARLTGDGAAEDLLAPLWSRRKREVLNRIDGLQARLDTVQGRKVNAESENKQYV